MTGSPPATGTDFEFTRILKPLTPFREDLLVLGGLEHHNGNALGDGGGDHARAGACFLTGVHPKKTSGSDIHGGHLRRSDRAARIGNTTRFASIELGCDDTRTVGACDSGYSCAYQNSISWRTPTSPMPPETNPRTVFERMFGTDDLSSIPRPRPPRRCQRRAFSISSAKIPRSLQANSAPPTAAKSTSTCIAVREIEKRIESAEQDHQQFNPDLEKPAGMPVHLRRLSETDVRHPGARDSGGPHPRPTFMIGREGSQRTYDEIGMPDPHHPLTPSPRQQGEHREGDPDQHLPRTAVRRISWAN